jgi:PPOX class probable F420-dependent enzyme
MSVSPEVDAFLATHTRTMLVTLRADGSPTVHPMLGLWNDGALWFNTYGKSVKVRNIERDPRVCCVVLGGDDNLVPPAVVLHGDAEVMPPGTSMPRLGDAAPATAPAGVTGGIVRKVATRVATNKRILFRVSPRHAELRS